MKAFLKNYRQAPRKVRLVAGLLRKRRVSEAMTELDLLAKRAGFPIKKLLMSAVASAKEKGKELDNLFIKELTVDKGVTLKRMMPAAMGTGHRINKRTSNISLFLEEKILPTKNPKEKTGVKKLVAKAKNLTQK